jgi:hypothetical protein
VNPPRTADGPSWVFATFRRALEIAQQTVNCDDERPAQRQVRLVEAQAKLNAAFHQFLANAAAAHDCYAATSSGRSTSPKGRHASFNTLISKAVSRRPISK